MLHDDVQGPSLRRTLRGTSSGMHSESRDAALPEAHRNTTHRIVPRPLSPGSPEAPGPSAGPAAVQFVGLEAACGSGQDWKRGYPTKHRLQVLGERWLGESNAPRAVSHLHAVWLPRQTRDRQSRGLRMMRQESAGTCSRGSSMALQSISGLGCLQRAGVCLSPRGHAGARRVPASNALSDDLLGALVLGGQ